MELFCKNSEQLTLKLDSHQFLSKRYIMCTQITYFETKKLRLRKKTTMKIETTQICKLMLFKVSRGFCCNTLIGEFKQKIPTGRTKTYLANVIF